MKIGVVIPVVQDVYVNQLLCCIEQNSVHPDSVIIIDNSEKGVNLAQKTHLRVHLYKLAFSLSVNASWNYGIQNFVGTDIDLISILNDDLLIERLFFEKLIRQASRNGKAGVFCPQTLPRQINIENALPVGFESCSEMSKREGWAWTIRKNLARHLPPIPDKLKTFCGDDWYWYHCHKESRPWMKIAGCWCYHYVGQSVKIMNVRQDLHKEKRLLNSFIT